MFFLDWKFSTTMNYKSKPLLWNSAKVRKTLKYFINIDCKLFELADLMSYLEKCAEETNWPTKKSIF